jgi:hypothetical protein
MYDVQTTNNNNKQNLVLQIVDVKRYALISNNP